MGSRRKARECTLQILFQCEIQGVKPQDVLEEYWQQMSVPVDVREFAKKLAVGTWESLNEIDAILAEYSANWKLSRMALVDKNILRMSVYELKYLPDIPVKVTLNESIEIAKKYGTKDSSAFINGILDQIAKTTEKAIE